MKKYFWVLGILGVALTIGFQCAALRPRPIFVSPKKGAEKTAVQPKKEESIPAKTEPKQKSAPKAESPEKTTEPRETTSMPSFEFRQAVMRAIDDYLGTPYKWGGEDSHGMDCSGFVRAVFRRAAKLDLPHSVGKLAQEGGSVSLQHLQFGDLIFFRKTGNGKLFHVGIYLGSGNFAHASTQSGVTISKLSEKYYKSQVAFARRLPLEGGKK